MDAITIEQLSAVLAMCADRDEDFTEELSDDTQTMPFDNLGYDSLALFNVTVQIEKDFGVSLSYDQITNAETPIALLEVVNGALRARA